MRKRLCCAGEVEKKTVVEGSIWDSERETPRAPALSEITFPPCPKGPCQLSPKPYLNLHNLGECPGTPNVRGSHKVVGRQRLCPVGPEKKAKQKARERKQKWKSEASSCSWAESLVHLDLPGFNTKCDLRWPLPAAA